jgi:hypothetical protein
MLPPPAPESSIGTAGACSDWALVLHAFFDGELDAAGSVACMLYLGRCRGCSGELKNLKSMRQKIRRPAIRWAAPLSCEIGWLIAPFGTSAADFGEERASSGATVFDIFDAGIHGSKKLYILGIKLELAESPV